MVALDKCLFHTRKFSQILSKGYVKVTFLDRQFLKDTFDCISEIL